MLVAQVKIRLARYKKHLLKKVSGSKVTKSEPETGNWRSPLSEKSMFQTREEQMLNPKYQRYADRLRELIEEGHAVAESEKESSIPDETHVSFQAWLTKVRHIIPTVFGSQSAHARHLDELIHSHRDGLKLLAYTYFTPLVVGLLEGALDDLEKGFLLGQEYFIAGEVFDSVLEQAKYLTQHGFKDPAAVLARVVLEDALKRIARGEGIDDTLSASRINDELKRIERYPQPQWRLIQACLDIGNSAAHGQFSDYSKEGVEKLIEDIERFLATEFRV